MTDFNELKELRLKNAQNNEGDFLITVTSQDQVSNLNCGFLQNSSFAGTTNSINLKSSHVNESRTLYQILEDRMFLKVRQPSDAIKEDHCQPFAAAKRVTLQPHCFTCKDKMLNIFPQTTRSGNCRNCGNFIVLRSQDKSVLSQACKEFPSAYIFRPEVNPSKVLSNQSKKPVFSDKKNPSKKKALTNQ